VWVRACTSCDTESLPRVLHYIYDAASNRQSVAQTTDFLKGRVVYALPIQLGRLYNNRLS
jgi:hypothetical protein